MLLAPREILEGEGEVVVTDGAEVALESVFETDRSLGFAVHDDFMNLGELREKFCQLGRLGGGNEKIEIVKSLL